MQPLRTKKVTQPLGTKKKSLNLLGQKNPATSWYTKKHTTSWDKNVLKIQILVTNKIEEIGTDHIGLVLFGQWKSFEQF